MEIKAFLEIQDLSEYVADQIVEQLKAKPQSVLYLASGQTQIPIYSQLVKKFLDGGLSFSQSTICALDEYIGFKPNEPHSFHYYMRQNLLDQIDINKESVFYPNGAMTAPEKQAKKYFKKLHEIGPPDLALLGLGMNGHIAFNEPGSDEWTSTRVVKLTEETRQANQGDFSSLNQVPKKAITMGIPEILTAQKILLVATGERKKVILEQLLATDPSPILPASYLKTHLNCELITDQEI